jgi:Cu(I)/Ag(I) efflux system membrane protein CusA/SilA
VASVWGKAGVPNTATDPAGLDMIETTVTLSPRGVARGHDARSARGRDGRAVRMPGVTNAWTMPIKGRIDMLATASGTRWA